MKIFAYILSALIGFAIGHYVLQGATAAFASILISYHLYLLFLVLMAKQEKGLSLPVGQTILTHMAFLLVVIGLPYMRTQIPFFSLISLLIPGLAPFETMWLFSGQSQPARKVEDLKPVDTASATSEDHREFVEYLRNGHRPFRKPRGTVDDEFRAWLADRAKKRAAAMVGVPSGPAEGLN
ncbi:MAG: hypothetical protein ACRD25_05035 [Terracidiphilus sp.]